MQLDWDKWQAMRGSLDYCSQRMGELEREGAEGRAEYEAVADHAMATAARLLEFAGSPRVSTASLREQWHAGRSEVMVLRERIAAARIAHLARLEDLCESAGGED